MRRVLLTLLFCAAAQAATLNVNLSVSATLAASSSGYSATGTATLSGGITDTGTFSATIPETALESATANVPYTLTLKQGTMAGTLTLPIQAILSSSSGSAPATVTSASGSYAGDTGTFNLTGTGGISASGFTATFSGSGTITTGGTVSAPPPTISAVQDAASYTANIAPGSIFVVKGTNLSASGYTALAFPLPTTSGGTSITFTPAAGGTGIQAYLIYTYLESGVNQLAAVLPSTVAPGSYNVTVTFSSVPSAAFPVTVVTNKVGIITQDSTGSGLAAAQVLPSYALVRLTTGQVAGYQYGIEPAHPGDTVVAYGTGLGAVTGGDNIASAGFNFLPGLNVQVILGGTTITPSYAGRTPGASGLDQITFTIPTSISTTGCSVALQISVNGNLSSATSLSIAPSASATACVYPGLTTTQLQMLDNGGTIAAGAFDLFQTTTSAAGLKITEGDVSGGFAEITGFELSSATSSSTTTSVPSYPGYTETTIGSCTVITATITGSGTGTTVPTTPVAGGKSTYLDAGTVTINGPSGSNITNAPLTETNDLYSLLLVGSGAALTNAAIVSGTYSLSGAGGKDVGAFNTSIALSPLTITGGLPTSITESAGVTINWTGGNAADVVEILGDSILTTGSGASLVETFGEFICTTTAGTGGFTVAPAVLTLLPKTTGNGIGTLSVTSTPAEVNFSAPLTAGGSVASILLGYTGTSGSVTYQ